MVIIKATRLQTWAPAGGGARVGHRPPPLFATFFSFLVPFGYFLFHGVGVFWACPPPYENFCGRP